MTIVTIVCGLLLVVAGILALIRVERGPSMLNRTIALDVFATVLIGAIALEAAYSRRTDTLPILVVLSLVGFVGSVSVARFAAKEPDEARRVRTPKEIAHDEEVRRRAEEKREQGGAL
ncbi:monovalent cation/H+ antiporter complex subunit F [Timonella senegalensis]|uniref:monovalent cation/H+ antiporter complex subunit F n=1 Tax=Timonella senegalensis TaxID=1465825 RepID=UPI0028A9565C|nr:monovalent cation/H+ antiporter complex subunit F [Timonella senegalensis]